MLLMLLWLLCAPAIVLSLASWRAGRRYLQLVAAKLKQPGGEWSPPVTLIVPVKGREEGLAENLRSLAAQDYPDYELIVTACNTDDAALVEARKIPGMRVVVAGAVPENTGEKIHNLLAAVAAARPSSEVLAFADSDGRAEPGWLGALVAPLRDPAVGVATGYRWYFCEQGKFWSLLRSAWNASIAGTFGVSPEQFAWGGAMAVRRETFESARVAQYWRGAVSDDYRLTKAMRDAGLRIEFVPRAMVATCGECTGGEFLRWATRQMIITRIYHPRLWWLGLAAHLLYCAAMAVGVAGLAAGSVWAALALLLVIGPGMWRGELRRRAAVMMFPQYALWLERHGWIYAWLAAPTTWIWLLVFLLSAGRRRIEWRRNVYELRSPSETRSR